MNAIGIIPARYGSSRFPGKPLAMIDGVSMIERVYRRASQALPRVVIATDDQRIACAAAAFGAEAVMTSPDCPDGTTRVYEAYARLETDAECIVNIQGDEPFISPDQILSVIDTLHRFPCADISTLALNFDPEDGFESLFDPNRVKMVTDGDGRALYFSRSIIPYTRDTGWQHWLDHTRYLIHIGLYAFRPEALAMAVSLPPSPLENAEGLEQLRWLYHGMDIRTAFTDIKTYPVDTPEDLEGITHPDQA